MEVLSRDNGHIPFDRDMPLVSFSFVFIDNASVVSLENHALQKPMQLGDS